MVVATRIATRILLDLFLLALLDTVHAGLFRPTAFSLRSCDADFAVHNTRKINELRGGGDEATLDEKVHQAMKKLGLDPPILETESPEASPDCEDGACPIPPPPPPPPQTSSLESEGLSEEDAGRAAKDIAESLNVDLTLSWAALGATAIVNEETGARTYNEEAAREMIKQELKIIEKVPTDSAEVKQLVSEGYDTFLSRRALAFADNSVDDARAILLADQMDKEEEEKAAKESKPLPPPPPLPEKSTLPPLKSVAVDKDFDPTKIEADAQPPSPLSGNSPPKPAKKADVVFEATAANVHDLVLESPVPVLLDVYADWCGPCKVLGPALEEMAVKAGGAFRLVKLNTDNERSVSGALEVQSLPTVFGVKDGRILNMFVGMPKSEDAMKNFMMGLLVPGAKFEPPVTSDEASKYRDLSSKLVKVAAASSYSFSARERLNDRVTDKLDQLVEESGSVVDADDSASVIRSLLSNAIRDPYSEKFRTINLENKVISAKIGKFKSSVAILKSVGFVMSPDGSKMILGQGKRVINVAPLSVAKGSIDKWVDKQRYEVAKASRKRKDELDRIKVQAELEARREEEDSEEEEEEEVDPDACVLRVRVDGKKKFHDIEMRADDSLKAIIKKLPFDYKEGQITCVAKKLVVKSTDTKTLAKSLRELGLAPKATLVVAIGSGPKNTASSKSSLAERAAEKAKKKTGSHTMQSIGIYSKDDNAKGELIDGGGGVWYEQDVTDDEEEVEKADDADTPTADSEVKEEEVAVSEDSEGEYEYDEYSEDE